MDISIHPSICSEGAKPQITVGTSPRQINNNTISPDRG